MTMKISAILFLSLLSRANAVGLSSLRGETTEGQTPLDQLACTFKGGSSQDTCDATNSEDGSTCVWCSITTYGVCVSEAIAAQMKQSIPGIDCDDNGGSDDDDTNADDDKPVPPPTPDSDDDVAPNDDSVPDDYWRCIEKYSTADTCLAAKCSWCDNKGGYGICMDEETAKNADGSDWYSCTMPSSSGVDSDSSTVEDPSDPTCLAATIGGDESSCKAAMDVDGNPCDWCSFQGYDFCLNDDQAQISEQYGASCGDRANEEPSAAKDLVNDLSDPSDPTCLAATIGGDESSCKSTSDVEGNSCDWCSFQGYDFCLNGDQSQIAEQYGASCGDGANEEPKAAKDLVDDLSDPSDPTCIAATIGGDESSCKATADAEGNSCDWCSFQGYDFCLNGDQAQIVEQYGASCGDRDDASEVEINNVSDPSDPTCAAATIGGDESSCKATMDAEGQPCDWCSFQGYDFCLNTDQAQAVEQYGASCNEKYAVEYANDELSDPSDPSCVAATIGGDESSCKATMDADGKPCDWCTFQGVEACMNVDQAQIVEQYGASCGDRDSKANSISTSTA